MSAAQAGPGAPSPDRGPTQRPAQQGPAKSETTLLQEGRGAAFAGGASNTGVVSGAIRGPGTTPALRPVAAPIYYPSEPIRFSGGSSAATCGKAGPKITGCKTTSKLVANVSASQESYTGIGILIDLTGTYTLAGCNCTFEILDAKLLGPGEVVLAYDYEGNIASTVPADMKILNVFPDTVRVRGAPRFYGNLGDFSGQVSMNAQLQVKWKTSNISPPDADNPDCAATGTFVEAYDCPGESQPQLKWISLDP